MSVNQESKTQAFFFKDTILAKKPQEVGKATEIGRALHHMTLPVLF